MTEPEKILLSWSSLQEFSGAFSTVLRALPPQMAERLHAIRRAYLVRYGVVATCQRMNNRTVAEILAEYQPDDVKPIASGEMDGVRYQLYEAPPPHTTEGAAEE
jgi:endonuclease/exonuclease/phosphatase (EEP) superfamily protein YafD